MMQRYQWGMDAQQQSQFQQPVPHMQYQQIMQPPLQISSDSIFAQAIPQTNSQSQPMFVFLMNYQIKQQTHQQFEQPQHEQQQPPQPQSKSPKQTEQKASKQQILIPGLTQQLQKYCFKT